MNPTKWVYACSSCGKLFPLEKGRYLCPECGPKSKSARPLEGILEAVWEGEAPTERVPLPVEAKWFPPIAKRSPSPEKTTTLSSGFASFMPVANGIAGAKSGTQRLILLLSKIMLWALSPSRLSPQIGS